MQRNCYKLKIYAVCPKCNKLHKTAEILEDNKCKFVEFPKHPMKKYRAECGAELLKNIPVTTYGVSYANSWL